MVGWIKFTNGDRVILDKKYKNSSIVTVVSQTPNNMFTKVTDGVLMWDVMSNRLTLEGDKK